MFEKEAEEISKDIYMHHFDDNVNYPDVLQAITVGVQKGAEFGYNKANEWQTGEPIKGREIFARNIANCNLLATYFDGAWRNVWNGGIIDFDKIIKWRYTGFKNNGEEIVLPELKESK